MTAVGRITAVLAMALLAASGAGCRKTVSPTVAVAKSLDERAERRAAHGAPPVIPHVPLSGTCVNCHAERAVHVPGVGIAPANPHLKTTGLSTSANCRQCHVFKNTSDVFVQNDFVPLRQAASRLASTAMNPPPVIPHRLFMHEDCQACHTGPAARPEILCRHPERARCQQCHVQSNP